MSKLTSDLLIGALIGQGHFGKVHSGTDSVHGDVAVKIMTQRSSETDAEWQARKAGLLQEGRHLSQAQHRNVVHVLSALESASSDAVHLVMEFCEKGSFQKAYDKGPIRVEEVLRISTDIGLGLEALHLRGMLHRDIKPGNLLQDRTGCCKLGDFGLVTDNIIMGYGSQNGYLDHLAPEVWAGSGTSVKTDIWALGVTLYRLLHGARWYAQITDPQDAVKAGGFANGLPWLPHIPKKWRSFIRKMLSDSSATRFQTANQVLTALARLPPMSGLTSAVTSGGVTWRWSSNRRRNFVEWTIHSPRRHEWKAWSEPTGSGNKRRLGSSNGVVSRATAEKQLQAFFESQF